MLGPLMADHATHLPRGSWRLRLRIAVFPLLFGAAVAAFTYGALSQRVTDRADLLPQHWEALILGVAFALASFARPWAIVARALIPVPTFLLYLSVFLGKAPPLPFGGAFAAAGCYALCLTALSAYFAERPRLVKLRARRQRRPLSHA